jgi:hypothetical protein
MTDEFNSTELITTAETAGRGGHQRGQAEAGTGNGRKMKLRMGFPGKLATTCHICRILTAQAWQQ